MGDREEYKLSNEEHEALIDLLQVLKEIEVSPERISNWDTSKVTYTSLMFNSTYSLTTIYVSDVFDVSSVNVSNNMFANATSLVGGNGTTYGPGHTDKEYARTDTPDAPGYFTAR